MAQFAETLPVEVEEAAIIDGAGVLSVLFRVNVPMLKPVIATIVILNFQSVWSEFFWALIMLKDENIKTLTLGLMNFSSQHSSNYGILTAGLSILTVPVIIVYMFLSESFVKGLSMGAVKG